LEDVKAGEQLDFPIIVDANGFFLPFQFGINLDAELTRLFGKYTIVVPNTVLAELSALRGSEQKAYAAYELAQKYKRIVVPGKGDESIVRLARKLKCPVLTNDRELKKRLRAKGIQRVVLKGKSHLEIE